MSFLSRSPFSFHFYLLYITKSNLVFCVKLTTFKPKCSWRQTRASIAPNGISERRFKQRTIADQMIFAKTPNDSKWMLIVNSWKQKVIFSYNKHQWTDLHWLKTAFHRQCNMKHIFKDIFNKKFEKYNNQGMHYLYDSF